MTSRLHKGPTAKSWAGTKNARHGHRKQIFFGILEAAETAWKIKHLSRILTVLTLPNNVVTGSHNR